MSTFIKRIGRYIKKGSIYGAVISGTAIITANVICWTNYCNTKEQKDITERNKDSNDGKDKTKANIYDLEEIGKQIAWAKYKPDLKSSKPAPRKQKEPVLQLNWDDVKYFPEKPKYNQFTGIPKQEGAYRVIFQAVFQNKSNKDQRQVLKAEVETLSTNESTLTKGYTQGTKVGLTLQAPNEVVKSACIFSKGFTLKGVHGNLEVKPTTWSIDELIRVPKNSSITVSKGVKEQQSDFDFEAMIGFEGVVKGTFYGETKQNVSTYAIPIETIIQELPKDMISKKNGRYYIKINGRCGFKYGIEQKIHVI